LTIQSPEAQSLDFKWLVNAEKLYAEYRNIQMDGNFLRPVLRAQEDHVSPGQIHIAVYQPEKAGKKQQSTCSENYCFSVVYHKKLTVGTLFMYIRVHNHNQAKDYQYNIYLCW